MPDSGRRERVEWLETKMDKNIPARERKREREREREREST